jgi:hypothetical protein
MATTVSAETLRPGAGWLARLAGAAGWRGLAGAVGPLRPLGRLAGIRRPLFDAGSKARPTNLTEISGDAPADLW